jgi:hypothetical protein
MKLEESIRQKLGRAALIRGANYLCIATKSSVDCVTKALNGEEIEPADAKRVSAWVREFVKDEVAEGRKPAPAATDEIPEAYRQKGKTL